MQVNNVTRRTSRPIYRRVTYANNLSNIQRDRRANGRRGNQLISKIRDFLLNRRAHRRRDNDTSTKDRVRLSAGSVFRRRRYGKSRGSRSDRFTLRKTRFFTLEDHVNYV